MKLERRGQLREEYNECATNAGRIFSLVLFFMENNWRIMVFLGGLEMNYLVLPPIPGDYYSRAPTLAFVLPF